MQNATRGLIGRQAVFTPSRNSSADNAGAQRLSFGTPTLQRWGLVTGSAKRRTASCRAAQKEDGLGKVVEVAKEWKAKFLTDDGDGDGAETTPEDPYEAALSREKFWGRIAVIGLGAVLLSERLSGKGIVTALNMATGVPVWEIEPALGLLVGAFLAAGIYPVVRRLGARADAAREAKSSGTPSLADIPARKWGDSFQVATGRLAFITLAGTVLAEATTGKGILALLNVETGVEITEIEAGLTFLLLLFFTEDLKAPKP
jgi:photosystem II protein